MFCRAAAKDDAACPDQVGARARPDQPRVRRSGIFRVEGSRRAQPVEVHARPVPCAPDRRRIGRLGPRLIRWAVWGLSGRSGPTECESSTAITERRLWRAHSGRVALNPELAGTTLDSGRHGGVRAARLLGPRWDTWIGSGFPISPFACFDRCMPCNNRRHKVEEGDSRLVNLARVGACCGRARGRDR